VQVVSNPSNFSWGIAPLGSATARLPSDPYRPAIFSYEKLSVYGSWPAARRVGFFLGAGAGASLTPAGYALLDAAVRWAAGAPAAPEITAINETMDGIHLSWTPVPEATSYIVLRSTSPDSGFVEIATGLSRPYFTDVTALPNVTYYYKIAAQNAGGRGPASPVEQARQEGRKLLVAITGKPRLKTWRSNQTPDVASAEPSQVGTYRAYVFKYLRNQNGSATITPVAPDELLPGSGFTLGLYAHGRIHISRQGPPDPEPGGMPPSPTWQATVTCIAKNNEKLTDVHFVQLPFQAEVNGFGRKLVRPILWLNAMERVTLLYRFPSNQPGRTKRRAPDGSDLFANEAVEDDRSSPIFPAN
jgi:hypothetical protein